jgi:hypothetical protein
MIRHVMLFAWIPQPTDNQKQQVVAELRALPPLLSCLCGYHVGPDAGIIEGNFDFAVVAACQRKNNKTMQPRTHSGVTWLLMAVAGQ